MIPFKIDKYSFNLPQNNGELTVKQFLDLRKLKGNNTLQILAILSGLDESIWSQTSDIDIDNKILSSLDWMTEPFDYQSFMLPDYLTIDGKKYPVPTSISIKTFGQKIAIQTLLEKCDKENIDHIDVIDQALQIYFERPLELIWNCKLEEGFPVASFFFETWSDYLLTSQINLLANKQANKQGRGLTGSTSSDTLGLYTRFRKASINHSMRFLEWTITRSLQRYGMKKNLTNVKSD